MFLWIGETNFACIFCFFVVVQLYDFLKTIFFNLFRIQGYPYHHIAGGGEKARLLYISPFSEDETSLDFMPWLSDLQYPFPPDHQNIITPKPLEL